MSHFKTLLLGIILCTSPVLFAITNSPQCRTGDITGSLGNCEQAPFPNQDAPSGALPASQINSSPAGVRQKPEQLLAQQKAQAAAAEQSAAEKLAEQKAQEFEQNRAEMNRNQQMLNMLGNGFSGDMFLGIGEDGNMSSGRYGGPVMMPGKKPSTCNAPVNQTMLRNFQTCLGQKSSAVKSYKSLVMDAESRIGYVVSPDGDILDCYTITIGSGGIGNSTASGTRQTETGFFYSQFHGGSKYQTNNPNYERKSIGIGEPNGKVLHSDHQNRSTWGCIGIEQAKWKRIFDMMSGQGWGAPIYVWTARSNSCQPSPGSSGAPASRSAEKQGGTR